MKKWIIIAIIVAILPIMWYLASPLFLNKTVNEVITATESTIIRQGDFIDADSFHKTSGKVRVIEIDGKKWIRLEDFKTTNGPDLHVYLAKDKDAKEFIDLGVLKGNVGNQNYEIPEGINIEDYPYILIWCKQFSVLFGSAQLQ